MIITNARALKLIRKGKAHCIGHVPNTPEWEEFYDIKWSENWGNNSSWAIIEKIDSLQVVYCPDKYKEIKQEEKVSRDKKYASDIYKMEACMREWRIFGLHGDCEKRCNCNIWKKLKK
ncbi:MAG TPA: hypothetical protein VMZ91_04595 [Candidatus Paceibacterota bacterium]|nr:hypothetical protein [Candidatus Paceibacterota bacterium]